MKKLWAVIVVAVVGATVATLIATSDDEGSLSRRFDAGGAELPDLAPPDEPADTDEPETSPSSSAGLASDRVTPVGLDSDDEVSDRRPRGSEIDVTEGEFAASSDGEDELEAELEAEEAEAEAEAEEDEEKAERRADRERQREKEANEEGDENN